MTVKQAIERADLYREEEDADSVMGRVLADALREAQAVVVQMREDAARVVMREAANYETAIQRAIGDPAQLDRWSDCRDELAELAAEIRALPAPAARTYDDARDQIAEVRHACGRAYLSVADVAVAMEGDPMRDADLPEEAYEPIPADELDGATIGGKSVKGMDIRVVRSFRRDVWSTRTMKYVAKRINDAALLSPAPAVAKIDTDGQPYDAAGNRIGSIPVVRSYSALPGVFPAPAVAPVAAPRPATATARAPKRCPGCDNMEGLPHHPFCPSKPPVPPPFDAEAAIEAGRRYVGANGGPADIRDVFEVMLDAGRAFR